MTETIVENEICPTCDTEVPAGAVFCFKCGNSVKPEETKPVESEICPTCETEIPANAVFCYHCGNSVRSEELSTNDNEKVSDVWLRGDMTEAAKAETTSEEVSAKEEKGEEAAIQSEKSVEEAVGQKESDETELESAASLRVKARRLPPREIEVRWEEHENAPNVWFLGGAVLLTLFSLIIYFLAMYLR